MGFFSWTCAKTGLPIMAGEVAGHASPWSDVVALYPDGRRVAGTYDGYGRIDGTEILDDMESRSPPKLVLKAFWDKEPYAGIKGASENEPGQGFFHDHTFVRLMFEAAAEGEIDTHQYLERRQAFRALTEAGGEAVGKRVAHPDLERPASIFYRCETAAERFDRAEDAQDREAALQHYLEQVQPALHPALRALPPLVVVHGLRAINDKVYAIAARACLASWCANEITPPHPWEDELLLNSTALGAPAKRPAP